MRASADPRAVHAIVGSWLGLSRDQVKRRKAKLLQQLRSDLAVAAWKWTGVKYSTWPLKGQRLLDSQ